MRKQYIAVNVEICTMQMQDILTLSTQADGMGLMMGWSDGADIG